MARGQSTSRPARTGTVPGLRTSRRGKTGTVHAAALWDSPRFHRRFSLLSIVSSLFLLLAFLTLLPFPSCADNSRKLVVIVANRVSLADLENPKLANISRIMRSGTVGLISPNCSGYKNEHAVMLTASAGAGSRGDISARECLDSEEWTTENLPASDVFRLRTGFVAKPGGAVSLGAAPVVRANVKASSPAVLGSLADCLHAAGMRTAAVGNADTLPDHIDRIAAVLAADSKGIIDYGRLSRRGRPAGMDYPALLQGSDDLLESVNQVLPSASFIVVYYGDTVRLDNEKLSMSDEAFVAQKTAVMNDLDAFVGRVAKLSPQDSVRIILVSFSPPVKESWDELTPICIYPSIGGRLLTSPSTRTPGLIAAADFAPTVVSILGAEQSPVFVGRAATGSSSVRPSKVIDDLAARVTAEKQLISPILWTFAGLGALAFVGVGLVTMLPRFSNPIRVRLLKATMILCASASLAMLLASAFPAGAAGYAIGTGICVLLVAAIGAISARWSPGLAGAPIAVIFLITAIVSVFDALYGGALCKLSLPSSYQLSGFRYYGTGNEYAAIMISTAALGVLSFKPSSDVRHRMDAFAMCGLVLVIALGVGGYGANYGGCMTAAVTFWLLTVVAVKGFFRARDALLAVVGSAAVTAGFMWVDSATCGVAGTHGARLTQAAGVNGIHYIALTIFRKIGMNLATMGTGQAVTAYLIFVPLVVLWFAGLRNVVADAVETLSMGKWGFFALLVGVAVGFLVNDSGIVLLAIMLSMTLLFLLYFVLERRSTCRE